MLNVVWRPHPREPPWISAWTLYFQKLESLAYIFVADSSGLQKFPEYISNALSFPRVFQIYKIPWDFQVFQTCKHPDAVGARQMLQVHSPDGSTFIYEMNPWLPSGKCDVISEIWLHQSIHNYLQNNCAKSHADTGFLKRSSQQEEEEEEQQQQQQQQQE